MYKITLINGTGETVILYPTANKDAPRLLKAELDEKLGEAHSLTLDIPFGNPGYYKINDLITKVQVLNTKTNTFVFEGRIYNSQEELSSDGKVYKECVCESELAYLNDTRTRAWVLTDISCNDLMQKVIDNHNAHTTPDKQFAVGRVDFNDTLSVQAKFENSLNFLINSMVNIIGSGYLVVRKENNIRYIDYVKTLDIQNDDIILTKNIKDMTFTKDLENIATRVIPIGKDNLTIESVNNNLDYLVNTDLENELGIVVEQAAEFSDINDATTLKAAGQNKLTDMGKATYKLISDTLDLSTIGIDPNGFNIGSDTNVICTALNFSQSFTIIEKDTDLLAPQDCKLTFDNKTDTLPNRQIELQRVAQYVNNLLTGTKQLNTFYLDGYINLLKNQMGAMADTAEKQNTKCILFEDKQQDSDTFGAMALGTKGFMIADTLLENGEWDWRTFGTGKGFTADLIVAGTFLADRIMGGTLMSKDGLLKISLDNGAFTFSASDTGWKAIEFINRTISFFDYIIENKVIGCLQTVRQNNTIPGVEIQVQPGSYAGFGKINADGTASTAVEYSNNSKGEGDMAYIYVPAKIMSDLYSGDAKGLSQTITISDGTNTHNLSFSSGILTRYN